MADQFINQSIKILFTLFMEKEEEEAAKKGIYRINSVIHRPEHTLGLVPTQKLEH